MKPGKTDPPSPEVTWIGYLFMMREMQVGFTEEKLKKIEDAILPFTSTATGTPVMERARHTIGLLEHASNIFVLGKAFFHAIRDGPESRTVLDGPSHAKRDTGKGYLYCSENSLQGRR